MMNPIQYARRVAAFAAALIGARRPDRVKAVEPAKAPPRRRPSVAQLKALAFGAFPNHFGNYLGKRDARPAPRPLTPDERFYRLAGEHECRARDYRWKRSPILA